MKSVARNGADSSYFHVCAGGCSEGDVEELFSRKVTEFLLVGVR